MVCKLLKICSIFLIFCVWRVGAEEVSSGITIDANSADVSIKGEVKGIISVKFSENSRELRLFEDNGKETDEDSRTFTFKIRIMTSTGAKLRLEGKDGLSFDGGSKCWMLSKKGSENSKVVKIRFRLKGMDKSGNLDPRSWDEEGFCYTFKESDGLGEWRIIVNPISEITNEESGIYKGSLKVSIVAA